MKNAQHKTLIAALVAMVIMVLPTAAEANNQIKIYAPNATSVSLKGAPVELTREGEYVLIEDQRSSSSGGQNGGNNSSNSSSAPVIESVSPDNGRGEADVFSLVVSDADGANSLKYVELLINENGANRKGIHISYNVGQNKVYFYNSDKQRWQKTRPGRNREFSSSNGSLDVSGVQATKSGSELILDLPVSFTSAMNGKQNIYAFASDKDKEESGWKKVGSYRVERENRKPRTVSVSSELENEDITIFTAVFEDEDGAEDITKARLMINNGFSAANSVYLMVDAANEEIFLRNDAGSRWIGTGRKNNRVLANNEARIDTSNVRFRRSENRVTVEIPVEFTGSAGINNVYSKVADSLVSSEWAEQGLHEVSKVTVADNGDIESEFEKAINTLTQKKANEQGIFEYTIIKGRLVTGYTAVNGEKLVQAADLASWQGASRNIKAAGEKVDAVSIDNKINGESILRLNGEFVPGLRLVYRYKNAANYQFIEVREATNSKRLTLVSGYVSNGHEGIRKEVTVKKNDGEDEILMSLNLESKRMSLSLNDEQIFGGAFSNGIQGDVLLASAAGQLDIVYSQVN